MGWIKRHVGPEAWRTELVRCSCMREADEQARAERARRLSDLGSRHQGCTFASFDVSRAPGDSNARAAASSAAWASDNRLYPWLVLWGDRGTGKTHLLAAAFNALVAAGKTPIYVVAPMLLDHFREGYDAGDYGERFRSVMEAPLLLLDDVGSESRTRWTDEALFKLLDHRYRYELPTAIATNVLPCDLEVRIASRLQDVSLAVVVELVGSDMRRRLDRPS